MLLTPDAIGGQSGSAIWDVQTNIMQALIAWSWGGQTGAQQTAEIYRMTVAASVEVAGVRPEGLIPLNESDVELEEGFHVLSEATGNIKIQDLPIWYDPNQGPNEPEPDCPGEPDVPVDPEPGVYLPRSIFNEYLKSIEGVNAEFREMLAGGEIPEEPIQPPSSNTFGL